MSNNYKTVIDEFSNTVTVDYDNKKLYNYSNKDEIIYYNAEIIEDGKPTGFWTNPFAPDVMSTAVQLHDNITRLSNAYAATMPRSAVQLHDNITRLSNFHRLLEPLF